MESISPMEKILNIPGFVHLAEIIFGNLDHDHLEVCGQINISSKQILANPLFWIKKFTALSKEKQNDWTRVIQSVKSSAKEKSIVSYLKWNLKKGAIEDLPCYSSPAVQDNFRKKIWKICMNRGRSSDEDMEIVKILAPLTDNLNAPNKIGDTPIYWAAWNGHTEIVKILAPLTDYPNTPNNYGETPSSVAKKAEIRKILESFYTSRKRNTRSSGKPSRKRVKKF